MNYFVYVELTTNISKILLFSNCKQLKYTFTFNGNIWMYSKL